MTLNLRQCLRSPRQFLSRKVPHARHFVQDKPGEDEQESLRLGINLNVELFLYLIKPKLVKVWKLTVIFLQNMQFLIMFGGSKLEARRGARAG